MDGLEAQEIEGIWERIKRYININNVTATDRTNQQAQLATEMNIKTANDDKTAQGNMQFLIDRTFPKAALANPKIRTELLSTRVKELKVRGVTRYQVAGGTVSSDGIRGGRFLGGKTREEAIADLTKKIER